MNLPAVLVPNATNRAALTAIRSLGSKGCRIVAGAPSRSALGVASRYARQYVCHPSPSQDPTGFTAKIAEACREFGIHVILPAADIPANALLTNRALLPKETLLVLPPEEALNRAHDKIGLLELAKSTGVPHPNGFVACGDIRNDPRLEGISYPLVLKPRISRYQLDGRWENASVRIVRTPDQLGRYLSRCPEYSALDYLVQEMVPGEGRGVFLMAKEGKIQAVFAHRRIREKPPSGGVSTLCETAKPEPELLEYSTRLIQALNWSGVAMVEFKWLPETREAWLMEINGRFWGSMQLAVASGVDFPWLLYRQEVLGETAVPPPRIQKRRLHWIHGDLDHFLIRLREEGVGRIGAMVSAAVHTRQGVPIDFDTFKLTDPYPFFLETAQVAQAFGKALLGRLAR